MYFVIVIDRRHRGRAAYFDQAEPTLLKNRRTQATEWAEYTAADQVRQDLQVNLPLFHSASVRCDGLNFQSHSH